MSESAVQNLSDVAETLLIPLYMRAAESQRSDALIKDDKAVALVQQMNYDFSRFKFEDHDQVAIVLRTREFDRHARDFLARNSRPTAAGRPSTAGQPRAVVVHIGCGLDARLERVDNGQVEWYDLDLPQAHRRRRGAPSPAGLFGIRQRVVGCGERLSRAPVSLSGRGHPDVL